MGSFKMDWEGVFVSESESWRGALGDFARHSDPPSHVASFINDWITRFSEFLIG
jgi:hypothetical protein